MILRACIKEIEIRATLINRYRPEIHAYNIGLRDAYKTPVGCAHACKTPARRLQLRPPEKWQNSLGVAGGRQALMKHASVNRSEKVNDEAVV